MENNIDLVVSNLGPVELGMPAIWSGELPRASSDQREPYVVKLAKRVQEQTGLPRPIVGQMLRVFTYTGPVRDRLLQYSEEDIQTAQHLDFDIFR